MARTHVWPLSSAPRCLDSASVLQESAALQAGAPCARVWGEKNGHSRKINGLLLPGRTLRLSGKDSRGTPPTASAPAPVISSLCTSMAFPELVSSRASALPDSPRRATAASTCLGVMGDPDGFGAAPSTDELKRAMDVGSQGQRQKHLSLYGQLCQTVRQCIQSGSWELGAALRTGRRARRQAAHSSVESRPIPASSSLG